MKRYSIAVYSLIVAVLALPVAGQAMAASDEEAALRGVVQSVADGWNRADGEAAAAVFAANGTLLTSAGDVVTGRGEIARHFNMLFDNWFKDTRLTMNVTDVHRLSPGIAAVQSKGGFLRSGETEPAPDDRNVLTFVMVKIGISWRILLLQDEPATGLQG